MKIRIMGTDKELEDFKSVVKKIPEINIISISAPYANRGYSQEKRIYIDCIFNTIWKDAELVKPELLEINSEAE